MMMMMMMMMLKPMCIQWQLSVVNCHTTRRRRHQPVAWHIRVTSCQQRPWRLWSPSIWQWWVTCYAVTATTFHAVMYVRRRTSVLNQRRGTDNDTSTTICYHLSLISVKILLLHSLQKDQKFIANVLVLTVDWLHWRQKKVRKNLTVYWKLNGQILTVQQPVSATLLGWLKSTTSLWILPDSGSCIFDYSKISTCGKCNNIQELCSMVHF